MSKNFEAKKVVVADIKEKFEKAKSVVVVHFAGNTVEEVTKLRNQFRENNVEYVVLKNKLVDRALDELGIAYRVGSVATGDWFATDTPRAHWIADTFHPLLCEMEGGAVAQVCYRNEVPFLSLKSISDCVLEHHDFFFNFPDAMKDLNKAAMAFLDGLEG